MIPERFAQAVVNGLAVLGAFLIGSLVTGLVIVALTRWMGRKAPAKFRALRLIGGSALAVLVAFILFGRGQGWNLFSGGADGDATANGPPQLISTPIEKAKPVASEEVDDRIVVTILGGTDVVAERFYLFNAETSPLTLAELQPKVLAAKTAKAALEIRFPSRNVLPMEHPAVVRLERWARKTAGLRVLLPADGS